MADVFLVWCFFLNVSVYPQIISWCTSPCLDIWTALQDDHSLEKLSSNLKKVEEAGILQNIIYLLPRLKEVISLGKCNNSWKTLAMYQAWQRLGFCPFTYVVPTASNTFMLPSSVGILSGSAHKISFTAISSLSNSHSFSYLKIKSLHSAVFFESLNQQTHCVCPEQLSICLPSDMLSTYTITDYLFTVLHGRVYRGLTSRLTSSNCQGLPLYSSWLSCGARCFTISQHKISSTQEKLFEYMTPALVPVGFSLIFHWPDSLPLLSWVHLSTWQVLHTRRKAPQSSSGSMYLESHIPDHTSSILTHWFQTG